MEPITKPKYTQIKPSRQRTLVDFAGLTFEVEGWYTRGRPAKYHLANGDPGYPAEPSDLFDVTIKLAVRHEHGNGGYYYSADLNDVLSEHAVDQIIDLARANMDDPDYHADMADLERYL